MTFDRKKYPPDWNQVRRAILERANHCCEGTPQFPDCRAKNYAPHPDTGSRVVLTIMHLWDMDPANVEESNLRAACQRCHLNWDRPHHLAVQRKNREARRRAVQPVLELEER